MVWVTHIIFLIYFFFIFFLIIGAGELGFGSRDFPGIILRP